MHAIATLWLVAQPAPVRADDAGARDIPAGQRRVRGFTGADGLHNLVISSIAQDSSGFLWLATDDGMILKLR